MEISSQALTNLANNTAAQEASVAASFDQFLVLLTTQLQNQDPLEPLDSNELTNQLVQFSQVEQQISGNQKLDAMLALQNNSLISNSLQYIDKGVYFRGNTVYNGPDTESLRIGYTLEDFPKEASMAIINAEGVTIRTLDLPAGTSTGNAIWDGKDDFNNDAPDGVYAVAISALSEDNLPVESFTGVPARVIGVETLGGNVFLSIDGDRQISASDILSVTSGTATTSTEEPEDV